MLAFVDQTILLMSAVLTTSVVVFFLRSLRAIVYVPGPVALAIE
jgi:hypothetical protein